VIGGPLRAAGSEFEVRSLGFGVWGSEFGVWGAGGEFGVLYSEFCILILNSACRWNFRAI